MRLAIESNLSSSQGSRLFVPVSQFSFASFPIQATDITGCDGGGNISAVDVPRSVRRRNSDGDTTGSPPNHDAARNGAHQRLATVAALTVALVLVGCEKQAARPPEKSLVRAVVVEPMGKVGSEGGASYLAAVRFDHETDLSFKVGGILVRIGPNSEKDWDEATPVKAGTVLAELKQADFTNALNSARAKAELAMTTVERYRKLRATDAISQQELDVTEADRRTAQAQLDQAEQNLRDSSRRGERRRGARALCQSARHGVARAEGAALRRYQPYVGRTRSAGSVDRASRGGTRD